MTSHKTLGTCPSKPVGRSGVKKLLPLLALTALIATTLLPITASAASYYPGYTCHYRDIAGSCLSYQESNPYSPRTSTARSLYGNRITYPFHGMFNANSTTQSNWDNRYPNYHNYNTNPYYQPYHYEQEEGWRTYYDQEDDTYRPYYFQNDDYYKKNHYDNSYYNNYENYFEYEHTRIYCTGNDCDTTQYQY